MNLGDPSGRVESETRQYRTYGAELNLLVEWLVSLNLARVVMESPRDRDPEQNGGWGQGQGDAKRSRLCWTAKAAKLTPEQRREIAQKAARARWAG